MALVNCFGRDVRNLDFVILFYLGTSVNVSQAGLEPIVT